MLTWYQGTWWWLKPRPFLSGVHLAPPTISQVEIRAPWGVCWETCPPALTIPGGAVLRCPVCPGASGAKGEVLQRLHPGSGDANVRRHRLHRGAGREVTRLQAPKNQL